MMSMMDRRFTNILEECLSRLDKGESLPEILKDYPHLADKLKPVLLVAMMSRTIPPPAPGHSAIRNGKNLLLAEMNAIQGTNPDSRPIKLFNDRVTEWFDRVTQPIETGIARVHPAYRLASLILIMVLTGGYLTVYASSLGNNLLGELFSGFERMGEMLRFLDDGQTVSSDFLPGAGFLLDNKGDMVDGYKFVYENDSAADIFGDPNAGQEGEDLTIDLASGITQPDEGDSEEMEEDKEEDKEEKEEDKEEDKEEKEEDKEEDKEEKDADKEEDKEEKEEDKEEKDADKEEDKAEKEADKEEKDADKDKDDKDKDDKDKDDDDDGDDGDD